MASVITFIRSTADPVSTVSLQLQSNAPVSSNGSPPSPLFVFTATGGTIATQQMTAAQLINNPIVLLSKTASMTANLNLPNPTTVAGSRVKILQNSAAALTAVLTITCTGGALFGGVIGNTGAFVGNANSGLTTITFTAASVANDYVDIFSNGNTWQVSGMSSAVGFTFA